MTAHRDFLEQLFRTAIAAAHPSRCLPPLLPEAPRSGRLILLAAGKAAGSMAEIAEAHYLDRGFPPNRLSGIAVARHGYGRSLRVIDMVEAGHPVPDQAGLDATARTLALAGEATADDLVLVLMSGGASANWIAPAHDLSLESKQAVNRALLRSGASIGEINTVRKHLSRIKGGRLARHAYPAGLITIGISDVPGDDPAVIGSGPTVPDPTTLADARAIVSRYRLDLPERVVAALNDEANEFPKPHDPAFGATQYHLAARPIDAFKAAEAEIRAAGFDCIFLGDRVEGEAREIAVRTGCARLRPEGAGQTRRDPVRRRTHRHHSWKRPRRTQPGIRPRPCGRIGRYLRHRRPGRRHRRHRRRRGIGRRSGRRLCRWCECQPCPRAGPRSGRLPGGQQFDSFLCCSGRSDCAGADLYQRERFPCHHGDRH